MRLLQSSSAISCRTFLPCFEIRLPFGPAGSMKPAVCSCWRAFLMADPPDFAACCGLPL